MKKINSNGMYFRTFNNKVYLYLKFENNRKSGANFLFKILDKEIKVKKNVKKAFAPIKKIIKKINIYSQIFEKNINTGNKAIKKHPNKSIDKYLSKETKVIIRKKKPIYIIKSQSEEHSYAFVVFVNNEFKKIINNFVKEWNKTSNEHIYITEYGKPKENYEYKDIFQTFQNKSNSI